MSFRSEAKESVSALAINPVIDLAVDLSVYPVFDPAVVIEFVILSESKDLLTLTSTLF
jgi:hypothetical protein